jgi:23S rRNA (adenine2030-N6)-methyltransferase
MVRKDKPLSYIETHAGRGLYDLGAAEALKTGEATAGIVRVEGGFLPAISTRECSPRRGGFMVRKPIRARRWSPR